MPVADCGVFEVGEHSEVGALESHPSADCRDYAAIPHKINMSESELNNYKQFNTKNKIV